MQFLSKFSGSFLLLASNSLDSRYVVAYKSPAQTTRKLQVGMSCGCERVATTCPIVQKVTVCDEEYLKVLFQRSCVLQYALAE